MAIEEEIPPFEIEEEDIIALGMEEYDRWFDEVTAVEE
jgi:hypothetical protein